MEKPEKTIVYLTKFDSNVQWCLSSWKQSDANFSKDLKNTEDDLDVKVALVVIVDFNDL